MAWNTYTTAQLSPGGSAPWVEISKDVQRANEDLKLNSTLVNYLKKTVTTTTTWQIQGANKPTLPDPSYTKTTTTITVGGKTYTVFTGDDATFYSYSRANNANGFTLTKKQVVTAISYELQQFAS